MDKENVIVGLKEKLESQQATLSTYYEYYKGNHAILEFYKVPSRQKNKPEIHNFIKKFIDQSVGYLTGNAVNIKYSMCWHSS